MKFDYLFRRSHAEASLRDRREPTLDVPGPPPRPAIDKATASPPLPLPALPAPRVHTAVRQMSPRQLAEWAHEMYVCGALNWEEYCLAGFPAELHPDYARTIGALTGEPAEPDRPRDMVKEWEERLAFAYRHNDPLDLAVRRTEKVLNVLRRYDGAPDGKRR